MKLKFILPLIVVLFAIASEYSGLDVALVRPFYNAETQSWPLKENWYTAGVLHSFGKDMVTYVMIGVLLLFIGSFVQPWLRAYRKGAGYLLLGSLLGPAIVAVLKASTHIYSPWDLTQFGGDKPYIRLFDRAPAGLPIGHAFPGGHSSGGFAFLAWFFFLSFYKPEYRYFGLALGLGVGGIFAATQEVRGAHFLSHDLFSLVICWYAALAVFHLMYRKELAAGKLAHS